MILNHTRLPGLPQATSCRSDLLSPNAKREITALAQALRVAQDDEGGAIEGGKFREHPGVDHAAISLTRLKNSFVYLAVNQDVFTRTIRAWCLSRTLDQQLTLPSLRMALENGTPFIHHSDHGVQYAAYAYVDLLRAHEVQISLTVVSKAEENGYAERFMRTIKEEQVDLSNYQDFADVQHQIGDIYPGCVYDHTHSFVVGVLDAGRA